MTADLLTAAISLLVGLPIGWLIFRKLGGFIVRQRQVAAHRAREPRTHGDDGGIPVAKGRVENIPR